MKRLLLAVLLCFGMAADAQITHSAIPCKMGDCGFSVAYTGITGITASRLLGRGSSGAGAAQEITPGTGLTISGTTLTPDVSGSGASGRLALWSSASGLTSDAGITYSGTGATLTLTATGFASNGGGFILGGPSDFAKWWGGSSYDLSLSHISSGVLGVGTGAAGSTDGTVKLTSVQWVTGSKPTCDATARGTVWYVAGGAGVADTFEVCRKDGSDVYAWTALY